MLLVTASAASFAFVTLPSAKSAVDTVPSSIEVEVTVPAPAIKDENTVGSKSTGRIEPFTILDELTESAARSIKAIVPSAKSAPVIVPSSILLLVTASAASFTFVTAPSANKALPILPVPGAVISDSLARVPLPDGSSKFTFAPLDWNTALCKPSNVIAWPLKAPGLLLSNFLLSRLSNTDGAKSFKSIVPSSILPVVTASLANFVFVTEPFAKSIVWIVPSNIKDEVTMSGARSKAVIVPSAILLLVTALLSNFVFVTEPFIKSIVWIVPSNIRDEVIISGTRSRAVIVPSAILLLVTALLSNFVFVTEPFIKSIVWIVPSNILDEVIAPSAISKAVIVPSEILLLVTASLASFTFVTLPFANAAVVTLSVPGVPISDSLANVPLPGGSNKFTFAPFDWNTALCKPSNVIAWPLKAPTLLLANFLLSKAFNTPVDKSLKLIVPSKMLPLAIVLLAMSAPRIVPSSILSVVTASGASFRLVMLALAIWLVFTEEAGKLTKSSKRANVPLAEGKFKLTAAVAFRATSLRPERVKDLPELEILSNFLTALEEFELRTKYLRTPWDVK